MAPSPEPARIDRLPPFAWAVIAVVGLAVLYTILQVLLVRPYLWPAGAGLTVAGDPTAHLPIRARPPDVARNFTSPPEIVRVAEGSPADAGGLVAGERLRAQRAIGNASRSVTFDDRLASEAGRVAVWRELYRAGVTGPVQLDVESQDGAVREVALDRPPAIRSGADGWARRHLGMIIQTVVFTGAALLLLLMRGYDLSAGLCVLALAFSAVGGGGPLLGAEPRIPLVQPLLTVFAWIASPLAFPTIALAILYFPTRSRLLDRYPWLHALPLLAAAPLLGPALMTGLYLAGVEAVQPLAVWDATHPGVYYAAFATALAINLVAVAEGAYRYRFNHDANERRRIRMALYTAVPGVLAYAVRDGIPIVAQLFGMDGPEYRGATRVILDGLVLLPAFGLVYAVGVAHVLGPRVVLRRSLQYALANRSLTVLIFLPAMALVFSLVQERNRTLAEIVTSSSALYALLIIASAATFMNRERARQWLDQRFFREEYDARKILLSLASRVRFETDPDDLATMVVDQLDEALHPLMAAILVSGIDEGRLSPVTVRHGSAEPLPLDGGLVSMLRWSDDPLDIVLSDPRSPARRLPPEEREWLDCTGAVLLVPVVGQDRSLIAVIALGERRSEEAYTAEDRQLLASIAAQMALGFDVVRLRRRLSRETQDNGERTRIVATPVEPMMECPRCGRCEDAGVAQCPSDSTAMRPVPSVPRTVDNKYRIEQLLGRGGMGAVYRARDMRLDRLVALKVVRADLLGDPEARRRFRREAQIVARLQHPSIVAVYDYGTFPDGGAYLVMELVRGEDLRHVLQRAGKLDTSEAMSILTAVCAAIGAAHREGVLHRDLKPENILLPGGGAPAKVLDFGVAKLVVESPPKEAAEDDTHAQTALTAAGMIIGTPAYMAPEQFHAADADARTDVFSLGVLAFEMLSGELPFGRGTLADVVLAQSRGVPPMPPKLVPAAAERAIRAALDPDPDRRPATPQAFATMLSAGLDADR
jgi:tRNA A-37 threonylcarbamoyl transferase component Bud32/GAF domain-containing protein